MISYDGLSCPGCEGPLEPRVLECGSCRIRVEGGFVFSEFAHLREDDLQFLRLFVMTEGRIRDMESALGVSYPTVKSRLAALKARLGLDAERAEPGAGDGGGIESSAVAENGGLEVEPRAVSDILDALERSEIDVAEALQRLEARKE